MTMYATWFYGFSPERSPVITFSKKGSRDALLRDARAGEVIVFVATKGENTTDENKGRVLGVAEIGTKAVRTEEVVDISSLQPMYFKDGKFRWPEAIPMLRAWRFDPAPLASEVLENGKLPPPARAGAVALSDADEHAIWSLNWVEVKLPQTEERRRQQRLADAFPAQPTKPGPIGSPGTHTVTVLEKGKAWTPPDDFDSPATFALQRLLEFWPCITTISKDMAQKRVEAADRQGGNSSVTILNGRAVNNNTDHKAIGVSDNVALAALDLLASIKPTRTTTFGGFNTLAIDDPG